MNGKQYNNIINNTIKNNTKTDRLEITRDVLNNMGVALPQGDLSTIYEILQSDDYMYWKSYTAEEAQVFANDGIAAIGITNTDIMLLSADEPLEAIDETISNQANITKFASNPAKATDSTKYYAYGTFVNNIEQSASQSTYASMNGNTDIDEPTGNTTRGGTTSCEADDEPDIDEPSGNTAQGGTTSCEGDDEPDIDEPSGNTSGTTTSTTTQNNTNSQLIANGTYYLNCLGEGKYLQNNSRVPNGISGTLADLGATIKWVIEKADSSYTIRYADDTSQCLAIDIDSNLPTIKLCTISNSSIPLYCKWNIIQSLSGGVIVRNVFNSQYLICDTQGIKLWNTIGEIGSPIYNQASWRVLPISYSNRELISFDVDDMNICIGETGKPKIQKKPANAFWTQLSDFTFAVPENSCVTFNDIECTFTGISVGSTLISATHNVTGKIKNFVVKVNKTAIIIIPGIMGSKLKTTTEYGINNANELLWPPIGIRNKNEWIDIGIEDIKIVERLKALKFDDLGIPLCPTVEVAWDEEDNPYDANTNFGAFEQYKNINQKLYETFKNKYDVKFFQYDWRLSNKDTALKLNDYIECNGYSEVYIVAHSMGGLVASNYINLGEYQKNKVKRLITLGTPFLGSLDIVEYFYLLRSIEVGMGVLSISEDDFLVFYNDNEILAKISNGIMKHFIHQIYGMFGVVASYIISRFSDLLYNIPSVYELFPNKLYFSLAQKNYIINKSVNEDATIIDSYAETKSFLTDNLYGFNALLMNKAEQTNDALYSNGDFVTHSVDSYYIVGTEILTNTWILFRSGIFSLYANVSTTEGDGTVPQWSAALGELYPKRVFYAKQRYHTEGKIENSENLEGLLISQNVFDKVINIISNHPYSNVDDIVTAD